MSTELSREQTEFFEKEVNPIVLRAQSLVIKTQENSLEAQHELKSLKSVRARVHDKFDPPVRQAHLAWKMAKELYNFFIDPFDQAEAVIKRKVVVFEQAEQVKRDEENRLAEAKRQEQERKEREKLEKRAQKASEQGKTELSEALMAEAEQVTVAPKIVAPEPPKAQSSVFKKVWRAEVTDLKGLAGAIADNKAPLALIQINQPALNALAKSVKNTMLVPGVRFYEDTEMAVRTK